MQELLLERMGALASEDMLAEGRGALSYNDVGK
jgi:hypothetical protein